MNKQLQLQLILKSTEMAHRYEEQAQKNNMEARRSNKLNIIVVVSPMHQQCPCYAI